MPQERDWWQDNRKWIIKVSSGVFILATFALLGVKVSWGSSGYAMNLYTEAAGILVTIFVLEALAERREALRLRAQLIREMASEDNGIAVRAMKEFEAQGWLKEGYLQNADLKKANLQHLELEDADLRRVKLSDANLEEAILRKAKLNKAELDGANLKNVNLSDAELEEGWLYSACLEGADLRRAKLQKAILRYACLSNAILSETHLEGANLEDANLSGAKLKGVVFDTQTKLPDGMYWVQSTDLRQYTQQASAGNGP